jgi:diguanylate cyclase (GGDEF)-like protein
MIDVDHFKSVNDRYGHAVGDRVLRRIADLLVTATRQNDVVARIGGEEFAVLLPHTDEETATDVAERVRAAVALHTSDPQVTVSIGVASLGGALFQHGEDPIERAATLMERADGALYRAKRAGRNRVCVWRARKREVIGVG